MANLVILESAQRELEEMAQLHLNLVGPTSARRITSLILDTLSRLGMFPLSGHVPQDKVLRSGGYRLVIAGKYICVYKLISDTVFVYHIAHGASNYPVTFKQLSKQLPNQLPTDPPPSPL
ncbi:MAG TPA: type II toxin-antitoxin system RelE/ParE family toxin [Clostridiales bacterium]|nr:type II toxin-antitoxin system RelE/ParE family toxin [Clostridiales bacterium]